MAYINVDGDMRWVPEKKGQLVERLSNWGISKIDGRPIRKISQPKLFRRCCAETRERTRRARVTRPTGDYQLSLSKAPLVAALGGYLKTALKPPKKIKFENR